MRKESAYILRLWCDSEDNEYWRASLENLRTRDMNIFGDFTKLVTFLNEQVLHKTTEAQTPCKRPGSKV
jgi:predicted secreted protein